MAFSLAYLVFNHFLVAILQILYNLMGNAIKFTKEGTIHIDVRPAPDNEFGQVLLSVADTGCGIPKDKHKDIFAAFNQVIFPKNL